MLKDGLLSCLEKTYKNYNIMMEYMPRLYNKSQNDLFKKKLSNFYCIPLTNLNFKSELKYSNYKKNFLSENNSINRFYSTNCKKGIEWFSNDKRFLYSNIIIFSNEKLAKDTISMK